MSCLAILGGYTKPCRDWQAGVKKFYVTEHENIASYTEVSGVITAITMVAGKKFYLYEQELNHAKFDEAPQTNRTTGANFIKQTFAAKLLKRSAATSYSLRALSQKNLAIIEVEQTGTAFLGGLVNGMSLVPSNSSSGQNSADQNGYDLTWEGEEANMAPTITQTLIDTIIV